MKNRALEVVPPFQRVQPRVQPFFYKALNINQLEVIPLDFRGATIKNNNNENRDF